MIKLLLKDLRLFKSDRRAIMLTFFVPISLFTLFAFSFGGVGQKKDEPRPTSLLMADEDHSAASRQLIHQLDSLKELDITVTTTDSAIRAVKKGNEAAVLILHKGLSDSMQSGRHLPIEFAFDGGREAEIGILKGALTGQLFRLTGNSMLLKNAWQKFDSQFPDLDDINRQQIHEQIASAINNKDEAGEGTSIMTTTSLIAEKENSPGLIHAVAGTSIMMLLFSVVGI